MHRNHVRRRYWISIKSQLLRIRGKAGKVDAFFIGELRNIHASRENVAVAGDIR